MLSRFCFSNGTNFPEMNRQHLNGEHKSASTKLDVWIDINRISDGALQVIKHIRPEWIVENIRFKVDLLSYDW